MTLAQPTTMIDRVLSDGELQAEADQWARDLTRGPGYASAPAQHCVGRATFHEKVWEDLGRASWPPAVPLTDGSMIKLQNSSLTKHTQSFLTAGRCGLTSILPRGAPKRDGVVLEQHRGSPAVVFAFFASRPAVLSEGPVLA